MARSSKKPSNNFLKLLLIGAAVALTSVFLYPSQQSDQLKNPSSSSDASKSESSQSEHVYLELRVPRHRETIQRNKNSLFSPAPIIFGIQSQNCASVFTLLVRDSLHGSGRLWRHCFRQFMLRQSKRWALLLLPKPRRRTCAVSKKRI